MVRVVAMTVPLHLFGQRADDLAEALAERGVEASEAELRRVLGHLVSEGRPSLDGMKRPVRRALRRALGEQTSWARLEVVERVEDEADGFVKYLFRSPDGGLSEAVRIPLEQPGRFTVCLSSQVGCAMRCAFCATGELGLARHLAPWEMVAAFCTVRDEAPGRVSGAVFMGQGEPLHNYDGVIAAAQVLSDPVGGRVAADAITISTVGLVPQIRRYNREGHPYRLIVSLTSALPDRRRRLLPVAGRFDLEDLADALRERRGLGRVTVAWVLLGGVNHDPAEVEALRALLGDVPLRVNLIDVNGEVGGFRRASDAERDQFFDRLQVLGVPVVRRYSGGKNRNAACGMLANARARG